MKPQKPKKIKVYGKPETTDGVLKPYHIHIMEDGESVPRVVEFNFNVDITGLPLVTMTHMPETVEIDLEGVDVVHEVKNLQIFNDCKEIMALMDYDYRLAGRKKLDSWKKMSPVDLKYKLDMCIGNFNTIVDQVKTGDRDMIDVTLFAIKVANYSIMLAQRNEDTRRKEKPVTEQGPDILEKGFNFSPKEQEDGEHGTD